MSPRRAAIETLLQGWPRQAGELLRKPSVEARAVLLRIAREMSRRFDSGLEMWAVSPWTELYGPPEQQQGETPETPDGMDPEILQRRLEELLMEPFPPPEAQQMSLFPEKSSPRETERSRDR